MDVLTMMEPSLIHYAPDGNPAPTTDGCPNDPTFSDPICENGSAPNH